MAAAAAAAPSPASDVADRIALATIHDGGAAPDDEGSDALTGPPAARKQRRMDDLDAWLSEDAFAAGAAAAGGSWSTGAIAPAATRLSSSFHQVKPSDSSSSSSGGGVAWKPPSAPRRSSSGGGGVATIVEVGETTAACELTSQLLVPGAPPGSPSERPASRQALRLCVSPLAGRSPDATGRVPVRAGVMEAGAAAAAAAAAIGSGGGGGGRGRGGRGSRTSRRAEALRVADTEQLLLDSPLIWADEGADEQQFEAVCARVAERDAFV